MIQISVPATSANVGVGFDCLGVAVDDYAHFIFQESEEKLTIKGCPKEYQNENNMVYRAFQKACHYLGKEIPNVQITIKSSVPVARGLGSSATCIVAGLSAAYRWFDLEMDKDEIFQLAYQIEGHGDNIGPAIFGGLCATVNVNDKPQIIKYPIDKHLRWTAIIPDVKVNTTEARAALPDKVDYSTVAYQVSHNLLLVKALKEGDLDLLKEAVIDQIHEPYRAKLIPEYESIKNVSQELNGTMYISGSGSTMMALTNEEKNEAAIIDYVKAHYPKWQIKSLSIDFTGVKSRVGSYE